MIVSDAAPDEESRAHIWNCRPGLPWTPAVPPRGPYKERVGRWGGSMGETPVATNQGRRFAVSGTQLALKWENAALITFRREPGPEGLTDGVTNTCSLQLTAPLIFMQ